MGLTAGGEGELLWVQKRESEREREIGRDC